MSRQIQPYRAEESHISLGPPEPSYYEPEGQTESSGVSVLQALRRRWPTALLIWIVIVGVGVPFVWLREERAYEATAQVQVEPVQTPILYNNDDRARMLPFFSQFLKTQQHLITSKPVLEAALAMPEVQHLEIQDSPQKLVALRRALSVENVFGTFLIEIGVTQQDPEAAELLTTAVLKSYQSHVVEAEQSDQERKKEVLREKYREETDRYEDQQQAIRALAEKYGTAEKEMLEILRQTVVEASIDSKQNLARAEFKVDNLKSEIAALDAPPTTQPAMGPGELDTAIAEDPTVSSMQQQLSATTSRIVELVSAGLTEEHDEVVAARKRQEWLEKELAKEKERAKKEILERAVAERENRNRQQRTALQQQLAAAERERAVWEQRVKDAENESLALGLQSLNLEELQRQAEETKQTRDRINHRIDVLNVEGKRPGRVTIASEAEIRPEGILDGRPKKTVAILGGALFLAVLTAVTRERFSKHVQGPEEVEMGMGLPVLGSVPCLSELKAGRVTQEDFIESHRVVRAALCGLGENGSAPQTILVTSAQAGEGKTSLAVSLASSLAEPGVRVLLIDGDLQAPVIGKLLKISPLDGLASALRGDRSLADAVVRSPLAGVDVLVADLNGGAARGVLDNRSAARLIEVAAGSYDHIVIDSPPLLGAADALVWAQVSDGVILSSLAGQSDRVAMRLAHQRLRTVSARVLGAVVGNVPRSDAYYSTSSYRYTDNIHYKTWTDQENRGPSLPVTPEEPDDSHSKGT